MARFELPSRPRPDGLAGDSPGSTGDHHLPGALLARYAVWFYRLRWLVIFLLLGLEILGEHPDLLAPHGLFLDWHWPLAVAICLILLNAAILGVLYRGGLETIARFPRLTLWVQIVADLGALTVAIHFLGSLHSFAAFAYLCHIVLACIFFPRRHSLAVTGLAILLYLACIAAELSGVLTPGGLLRPPVLPAPGQLSPLALAVHVGMALSTWLAVWFLTSRLSAEVRLRDSLLEAANQRLVAATAERTRHMLRTTHELKAPLAAIHANTQLLQNGYVGDFGREAREVVEKIAVRCQALSHGVQQMLQLANLTSRGQAAPPRAALNLAQVVAWAVQGVEAEAAERGIGIATELEPFHLVAVEDHMKMLFGNLVSNAVTYSRRGGRVHISSRPGSGSSCEIIIRDEGIGIEAAKLPRIFDDYYRTAEAAQHNPASTGLGLSIVRHIAQSEGFGVVVESAPGRGATFTVRIPAAPRGGSAGS
ncbi:MAG: HAMP domain-containing sensor histidine kinase [Gemmatimonadota bacterium]